MAVSAKGLKGWSKVFMILLIILLVLLAGFATTL